MITRDAGAAHRYGLEWIRSENAPGLSLDPEVIHEGGNSGYQALNLAYHAGAGRIVLLGYDMQRTGGRAHWFGDHPRGLQVSSPFEDWRRRFDALAADLARAGVEVINASRETALTCFRRAPLESIGN